MQKWSIPRVGGAVSLELEGVPGTAIVVVGANGSGKSALGGWFRRQCKDPALLVTAHRRIWLEASASNLSGVSRQSLQTNLAAWENQVEARHLSHSDASRPMAVLYDLLAQDSFRNQQVIELVEGTSPDATVAEVQGVVPPGPVVTVNRLLDRAGLGLAIKATKDQMIQARRVGGDPYPIERMSDGEKSCLLLAAEVVTAPAGCAVIVDEPERHMHRSISGGLIEAMLDERSDCTFVILTHDLDLAARLSPHRTTLLVLGGCEWLGDQPAGWDVSIAELGEDLPEGVRTAVLGGRTKVAFVEGEAESLDLPLYRLLFPEWDFHPLGGCERVIRATSGINAGGKFHWVEARGIVDGDRRTATEVAALAAQGVLSLGVNEIEGLYYCDAAISAVAADCAEDLETTPEELTQAAAAAGLAALNQAGVSERMAADVTAREVAWRLTAEAPAANQVAGAGDLIKLEVPSPYPAEVVRVNQLLGAADLEALIRDYPVRDTSLRASMSKALHFVSCDDYEKRVRVLVRRDPGLRNALRAIAGTLPA
jgi:ABC-type phosphonate transport system ATPase subunit